MVKQALEIGLVSEVLPPERLLQRAQVRRTLLPAQIGRNCQLRLICVQIIFVKNTKQELGEQWIREDRPRILRGGSTVEVKYCLKLQM